MRVLLDENLPLDLARDLSGHDVQTVVGLGWEGVKNGELLRRAAGHSDALVTMDRNLEFQ
jgi:predicted nuclease of predicted toxin-antitoxin system